MHQRYVVPRQSSWLDQGCGTLPKEAWSVGHSRPPPSQHGSEFARRAREVVDGDSRRAVSEAVDPDDGIERGDLTKQVLQAGDTPAPVVSENHERRSLRQHQRSLSTPGERRSFTVHLHGPCEASAQRCGRVLRRRDNRPAWRLGAKGTEGAPFRRRSLSSDTESSSPCKIWHQNDRFTRNCSRPTQRTSTSQAAMRRFTRSPCRNRPAVPCSTWAVVLGRMPFASRAAVAT